MSKATLSLKDRCHKTVRNLLNTCQNRAARSALRPLLTEVPDMQIRAMRYLPTGSWVDELLFTISGLIAEYPYEWLEEKQPQSFGVSIYELSQKIKANSAERDPGIERRLELLLQLEVSSLVHPLHGLVVQAREHKIPIDFATLFYHLHCWDDSRRWVQLSWAKDFWCPKDSDEKLESNEALAAAES
jgi:CRISPR type I-E-associated protein CasB/Cse2